MDDNAHLPSLSLSLTRARSAQMSSQTHTYTPRLIRRLPSYSSRAARTSLPPPLFPFVYVCSSSHSSSSSAPFFWPFSLPLPLSICLSPLAACLPVMELICLAHKECPSISAGLSVPREMVTNHTNMCICSVYIIVFLIVCVCV